MSFPREISSLPLTASQQKYLSEKGIQIVGEIQNCEIGLDIKELTKAPKTKTAAVLYEEEKNMGYIESFLENLDAILKGVLRPGLITELVGLPGSGRTQLWYFLRLEMNFTRALK